MKVARPSGILAVVAIGVAALVGCASGGVAEADPSVERPANCTGADFAGISAGVSAAMSTYLYTHPEVNSFITELQGQPRDASAAQIVAYENANPQTKAEITAIRAPLVDFDARCGYDSAAPATVG